MIKSVFLPKGISRLLIISLTFCLVAPAVAAGQKGDPGKQLSLSVATSNSFYILTTRYLGVSPGDEHERWKTTRNILDWSTLAGFWVTGSLGTIVAINRPTLFSEGRCATGRPIFGEYGCGELSTVHGMSAISTVVLYTAQLVFDITTDEEDPSPTGKVFTWIHRGGTAALPLAGILARYPEVIGITDPDHQRTFSRALRSIHLSVGYTTVGAYTVSLILE